MGAGMVRGTLTGALASWVVADRALEGVFVVLAGMASVLLLVRSAADAPTGGGTGVGVADRRSRAGDRTRLGGGRRGRRVPGGAAAGVRVRSADCTAIGSSTGVLALAATTGAVVKRVTGQVPVVPAAVVSMGAMLGAWGESHAGRHVGAGRLRPGRAALVAASAMWAAVDLVRGGGGRP
jgi:uncharacterized membrane protein YfcA